MSNSFLNSLCKPNSAVTIVELCVVFSNENISQNPQWPNWFRNINAHKSTEANSLAQLRNLKFEKEWPLHVCNVHVSL